MKHKPISEKIVVKSVRKWLKREYGKNVWDIKINKKGPDITGKIYKRKFIVEAKGGHKKYFTNKLYTILGQMIVEKTDTNWFYLAMPSSWISKVKEYCNKKPIIEDIVNSYTEKSKRKGKKIDKGQGLYFLLVDDKTLEVDKKTWRQLLK